MLAFYKHSPPNMKSFYSSVLLVTLLVVTANGVPSEPLDADELSGKASLLKQVLNVLSEENVEAEMESEEASVQVSYQNSPDRPLNVQCRESNGEAINRMQSVYSPPHGDRRFRFSCVKVAATPAKHCQWYNDINEFDQPLVFTCPSDYYINGIKSYHLNAKEDRRWSIRCCKSDGYHTESCELTDYINEFRATIDETASLSSCKDKKATAFFTGFYSYDDNSRHDRRWRIYQCKAGKN